MSVLTHFIILCYRNKVKVKIGIQYFFLLGLQELLQKRLRQFSPLITHLICRSCILNGTTTDMFCAIEMFISPEYIYHLLAQRTFFSWLAKANTNNYVVHSICDMSILVKFKCAFFPLQTQGGKHEEPTGLPPSSTLLHGHHASGPTPSVGQPESFTSKSK